MNLIRRVLGMPRKPSDPPAWASEVAKDLEAIRCRSNPADRANSTIRMLNTAVPGQPGQCHYWHILSGEIVWNGDTVVTDIHPTSTGTILGPGFSDQLARVRLLTGPGTGEIRELTPGQMMRRCPAGPGTIDQPHR